jgi:hypothetical protein
MLLSTVFIPTYLGMGKILFLFISRVGSLLVKNPYHYIEGYFLPFYKGMVSRVFSLRHWLPPQKYFAYGYRFVEIM